MDVGVDEAGQQHLARTDLDDVGGVVRGGQVGVVGFDGGDASVADAHAARHLPGDGDDPLGAEHEVEVGHRASFRYGAGRAGTAAGGSAGSPSRAVMIR